MVLADKAGEVAYVDAERIVVDNERRLRDEYPLEKYMRSNQGTLIHQKPLLNPGERGEEGAR